MPKKCKEAAANARKAKQTQAPDTPPPATVPQEPSPSLRRFLRGVLQDAETVAHELRLAQNINYPLDAARLGRICRKTWVTGLLGVFVEFYLPDNLPLKGPELDAQLDAFCKLKHALKVSIAPYPYLRTPLEWASRVASDLLPLLPQIERGLAEKIRVVWPGLVDLWANMVVELRKAVDRADPPPPALADKAAHGLITTSVAVKDYCVSRHTIARRIEDGTLKDHRPPGAPKKAPFRLERAAVAALWPRR